MLVVEAILVTLGLLSQLAALVWAMTAAPSKWFREKYGFAVLLAGHLPFTTRWRQEVEPADQRVLREFRRRFFIYLSIAVGEYAFMRLYLNFRPALGL
jgi:hypothetical protein